MRWMGHIARMENIKAYKITLEEVEGNILNRKTRSGKEHNIKLYLKELTW
jgi:hypothetical protein